MPHVIKEQKYLKPLKVNLNNESFEFLYLYDNKMFLTNEYGHITNQTQYPASNWSERGMSVRFFNPNKIIMLNYTPTKFVIWNLQTNSISLMEVNYRDFFKRSRNYFNFLSRWSIKPLDKYYVDGSNTK